MDKLPSELIDAKLRFLANSDLENCKRVCRQWYGIAVAIIQERIALSVGIVKKQANETWKDAIRAQRIVPVLETALTAHRARILPAYGTIIQGYGFTVLHVDASPDLVRYDLDQETPIAEPHPTYAFGESESVRRYELLAKPTQNQDMHLAPNSFQLQCSREYAGPRLWMRNQKEWTIIAKGEPFKSQPHKGQPCLISGHVAAVYNYSNERPQVVVVPSAISSEASLWEFTPCDRGEKLRPLFASLGIFLKKDNERRVSLVQFFLNEPSLEVKAGPEVGRWLWDVQAVTSSGLWIKRGTASAFPELAHLHPKPPPALAADPNPPCSIM